MITSPNGIELIKSFEAFRANAYHLEVDPPNVWTVGYGYTHGVKPGLTVTEEEATALLCQECRRIESAINPLFQSRVSQNQFDAIVSFTYNLGVGAFQGSTLLKMLNNGDYAGAADQFPKWVHSSGGNILSGLVRRRNAERDLFLTPEVVGVVIST